MVNINNQKYNDPRKNQGNGRMNPFIDELGIQKENSDSNTVQDSFTDTGSGYMPVMASTKKALWDNTQVQQGYGAPFSATGEPPLRSDETKDYSRTDKPNAVEDDIIKVRRERPPRIDKTDLDPSGEINKFYNGPNENRPMAKLNDTIKLSQLEEEKQEFDWLSIGMEIKPAKISFNGKNYDAKYIVGEKLYFFECDGKKMIMEPNGDVFDKESKKGRGKVIENKLLKANRKDGKYISDEYPLIDRRKNTTQKIINNLPERKNAKKYIEIKKKYHKPEGRGQFYDETPMFEEKPRIEWAFKARQIKLDDEIYEAGWWSCPEEYYGTKMEQWSYCEDDSFLEDYKLLTIKASVEIKMTDWKKVAAKREKRLDSIYSIEEDYSTYGRYCGKNTCVGVFKQLLGWEDKRALGLASEVISWKCPHCDEVTTATGSVSEQTSGFSGYSTHSSSDESTEKENGFEQVNKIEEDKDRTKR